LNQQHQHKGTRFDPPAAGGCRLVFRIGVSWVSA
jgi:hypothetical protein